MDFFIKNSELTSIVIALCISSLYFLITQNSYHKQKAQGWMIIIAFLSLLYIHPITQGLALVIMSLLSIREFVSVLSVYTYPKRIIFLTLFLFLLMGYCIYIVREPSQFLIFFVVISLSDIVAYLVGKNFPRKKGFTQLSPNKSLSGLIAQVLFLCVSSYLVSGMVRQSVFLGILAPLGDLGESFFKRAAGVKDMATYIPGHGGVLDRIDSSLVSLGILGILLLFALS